MTLQTVIFDFDGTIANSFEVALKIANTIAPEYGYRPARSDEVEALRRASYRDVASQLGVAWHKIPLIAARVRRELSRSLEQMQTFEGLPGVLSELRGRGLRLGILTSNAKSNVERFLTLRGLPHFDFISTSSSVWGKERRLKALLRAHGLASSQVAYVGDEVRDIEATKPLDICMIAVAWGYTAPALLSAHTPDYLIDSPGELLSLLRLGERPSSRSLLNDVSIS
jgi:phosphoglycolate phosphatase